jgi:hypothetical protein
VPAGGGRGGDENGKSQLGPAQGARSGPDPAPLVHPWLDLCPPPQPPTPSAAQWRRLEREEWVCAKQRRRSRERGAGTGGATGPGGKVNSPASRGGNEAGRGQLSRRKTRLGADFHLCRTGRPYAGGGLPGPPTRVGWAALTRPPSLSLSLASPGAPPRALNADTPRWLATPSLVEAPQGPPPRGNWTGLCRGCSATRTR